MATALTEARTAAPASERVVVLMTPTDKRSLEEKAGAAGISVGEFVRRAVEAYDPRLEDETLMGPLLKAIQDTGDHILASLDDATRTVRGTLDRLAERRRESEHR